MIVWSLTTYNSSNTLNIRFYANHDFITELDLLPNTI